jgi:hypothetical protein
LVARLTALRRKDGGGDRGSSVESNFRSSLLGTISSPVS